ncbi:MAG: thiamine pyrophosphate-dependent dehydrogenase E1 component subunit alpha [Verrucomicrobia bacterium]|nr:thiamine pyrophosphate-dependent dehydrogenase E1 component subunit alpha [Verrucomicrobiota bacterium]MBU1735455.1 thiamine pyrophosphate-dependent dehydrogenase E1 component subunit alpha [Verrucomicrobiota bacterium]MBU1856850.1 thiamine pyrophosphate-dependent dehydrogenase E1 component subunit alpha [Verrucomicrobiota bacterium]
MNDISIALYKKLYLMRRAEECIIRKYPENDMKTPMHMSMGQEAIPAGICQALGDAGQIYATYRSHAAFLAKTENVEIFFAELYGKETGTAQGKSGSMHLAAPAQGHMCSSAIVASCIPVAMGAGYANKLKANGQIACVFFGDGALDEGVFWESLNVASLMQIPVFMVCEDNGFAVHTPSQARRGYSSIMNVVKHYRCQAYEADTTDVEAIYRMAVDAMQIIREKPKPVFLYLKCYRYLEHVGIYEDFDAGYRSRSEYETWRQRDPIALQRQRLLQGGLAAETVHSLELAIDERIQRSIEAAQAAPFPQPRALYQGVFYEEH